MNDDKVNILIVDDHRENLLALEALLSNLNQNVVRAESGAEALRQLLQQDFALILLDVDMPGINGFETAELVRQRDRNRQIPIIFLTAINTAERHVFKGYSLGAVDYLTKPFVPEVLRSKVTAFVELYKKTEELQAERDFIATVLDGADSIITVLDEEQRIIRASRAFERVLGYSMDEVKSRRLTSIFVPPGPWNASHAENEWRAKDGSTRVIAWSMTPLNGRHSRGTHFVLTGNDVTERKRVEQEREHFIRAEAARLEAEEAERRAAFLSEASSMLASTLDYERTLINISRLAIPAFADWCFVYLALQGEEISSALIAHADPDKEYLARQIEIRPEDLSSNTLPVLRVFQTGTPELLTDIQEEELRRCLQDEQKFELLIHLGIRSAVVVPIAGRHAVIGVIGFVSPHPSRYAWADLLFAQELARRISLALENARLYREAQAANRGKDEFLATLSHELRTPLNAIIGWIQILRSRQLDEVTIARGFEAIERNARAQAELVEDMLDVSRIITGRLQLNLQPMELSLAVEAAMDSIRPAAEAKSIRLEYAFDPRGSTIWGDPRRLQQIVWNLLSNAVKFTPSGGLVRIHLEIAGPETRLTVRDNGKGISPQFLPFVFERFRQADNTISRTSGGLGLGLSIARHLVELHGGTIEALSDGEGHGATFTVTFPYRDSLSASMQNAS